MSKAADWFRSRAQKSRSDKETSRDKSSSSRFGVFGRSERNHSGEWKSESDSGERLSDPENPFRGRLPPYGNSQSRSNEFERPQHQDWRSRMPSTSRSDEFGRSPAGRQVYREWEDGPMAGNQQRAEKEYTFGDWNPNVRSNSRSSDPGRPGLGRYPSADWASQVSRSSTSTGRDSSGEYEGHPLERRSISREQEGERIIDRRQSVDRNARSYGSEGDQYQSSLPRLNETDLETFDVLLQNWPKLKSSTSDKRRFEARLLSLLEVESDIVVVGERPTQERWSLGIVDDGIKALGRAIANRGYPKLRKLSFTRCRMLYENPFKTLARVVHTGHMPNLEEVTFHSFHYINDAGFIDLAWAFKTGGHFSRLTTLILTDNGMRDEGLIALAREAFGSGNLSNLRKLHIGSHNTAEENFEEFHLDAAREFAKELSSSGHLPKLSDLRFRGCVHWKGVVCIVEALETRTEVGLVSLDLRHSPLGSEGMTVLARAFEAPQFSSLLSLDLSVKTEDMPFLLEAFKVSNLCSLQRIALSNVNMGEKELFGLAALLEARHLAGLQEFSANCLENTIASALALVRAYERNNGLVAKLNINMWPLEELQVEYEKQRTRNMELDELV